MVTILSAVVSIFVFRFRSRASLELKLIALIAFPEVGGLHHRYERQAAKDR